jgi:hypothetical protein
MAEHQMSFYRRRRVNDAKSNGVVAINIDARTYCGVRLCISIECHASGMCHAR